MPTDDSIDDALAAWQERRDAGDLEGADEIAAAHPDVADIFRAAAQLGREIGPGTEVEDDSTVFDDFRIRRELGRGGMGVVYEADQISLRRTVALKVLSVGPGTSPQAVQRFEREAHAAARLHHSNVVPIYAMGRHDGRWFYAMELVKGRPLGRVIEDLRAERKGESRPNGTGTTSGSREWYSRVAEMFSGVADALALAHRHGILHRDVKPSNLILDDDGLLKLVDFGLALDTSETGPSMTLTGDLIGTPTYMSPEQATAKRIRVDHRTDVYSLGATLYETLALRPPFKGDSLHELCSKIMKTDPSPPRSVVKSVPKDLETIVAKAMEKDRERRYSTAGAMARDLRAFAEGGAIRARRVRAVERTWRKVKRNPVRSSLVAAVFLLAVAGTFLFLHARGQAEQIRAADYLKLLARGEAAMGAAYGQVAMEFEAASLALLEESPADILTRAVELDPDRAEAYWLRVFAPGRTVVEREADAEAAYARGGVSRRSRHLYRTFLLELKGRPDEAAREQELAASFPAETPFDDYLEARLLAWGGETGDALAALGRAIDGTDAGATVRFLAIRYRSFLRRSMGDSEGVIEDLNLLRSLGDDGPHTLAGIAVAWKRLGSAQAERHFEDALEELESRGDPAAWTQFFAELPTPDHSDWIDRATARAAASLPEEPAVLVWRACIRRWFRDYDSALELSDAALREDAENFAARLERAYCLTATGRHQEALEIVESTLKRARDPVSRLTLQTYRAEALRGLNRNEDALVTLGEALESAEELLASSRQEFGRWAGETRQTMLGSIHQAIAGSLTELGRHEEALEAAKRAVETGGGCHGEAIYALALVKLGRGKEAESAARRALEDCHAHLRPSVVAMLGQLLWERGEVDEALTRCEEAVALDPGLERVWVLLASLRLQREDMAGAREAVDRAGELDPENPSTAISYAWLAAIRQKLGDEDGAANAAALAAELGPSEPDVLAHLGRYQALKENWPKAKRRCEEALDADPDNLIALLVLGSTLQQEQDHEGAAEAYRRYLVLPGGGPDRELVWTDLAQVERHRDPARALEVAKEGLGEFPNSARLRTCEGRALMGLGRAGPAREALEAAIRLGDRHAEDAYSWLGILLKETENKPAEALAVFEAGLRVFPDSGNLWGNRAIILLVNAQERKDEASLREALRSFDEAIRLGEDRAQMWGNRGVALVHLGREREALDSYDRALEADPTYGAARGGRVVLRAQLGDHAGALDDRAVLFEQGHTDYREALGVVWASTLADQAWRNPARALEVARRAREMAPDDPTTWSALGAALLRSGDAEGAADGLARGVELSRQWDIFQGLLYAQALVATDRLPLAARWYERCAGNASVVPPSMKSDFDALCEETRAALDEAVGNARARVEEASRLVSVGPGEPALEAALAKNHRRLGAVLLQMGNIEEAGEGFARNLTICRGLAAREGATAEDSRRLAKAEWWTGYGLRMKGRLTEALPHFRTSLEIYEALEKEHPGETDAREGLVLAHRELGFALARTGDLEGALEALELATVTATSLFDEHPKDVILAHELLGVMHAQAWLRAQSGDPEGAYRTFGRLRELAEKRLRAHPGSHLWSNALFDTRWGLVATLQDQGEAAAALEKLEELARGIRGIEDSPDPLGQWIRGLRMIVEKRQPETPAEKLDVGYALLGTPNEQARAFELYRKALEDPEIRGDPARKAFYIGACAASSAAAAAPRSEAGKIHDTALAWLREDLEHRLADWKAEPEQGRTIARLGFVTHLLRARVDDRRLAGVRGTPKFERIFEEILAELNGK